MKPGNYTQLYIQFVFAVKYRECLLTEKIRNEVFSYMSGTLTNKKHKSIIINGYTDHVHVFLGLNPSFSISDVVADLKRSSSLFINDNKWLPGKFKWQDGYGAFSYSKSHIKNVYNYILNQVEHHRSKPFKEEYLELLKQFEIEYDERYLFEFF